LAALTSPPPIVSARAADSLDPIESALATALERASRAGEWSTVTALAAELAARRSAHEEARKRDRAEVHDLEAERRKRGLS